MVLGLLTERIRQPSEPTHMHPHRQVLTFNVRTANERFVRITRDRSFSDTGSRLANSDVGPEPRAAALSSISPAFHNPHPQMHP
jgi:hypothetical protein